MFSVRCPSSPTPLPPFPFSLLSFLPYLFVIPALPFCHSHSLSVIPTKVGIQRIVRMPWIPAFARMTNMRSRKGDEGKGRIAQIPSPLAKRVGKAMCRGDIYGARKLRPENSGPKSRYPSAPFCHSRESGNPLPPYNGFPVGVGNDELCCGSLVKPEMTFPLPFVIPALPFCHSRESGNPLPPHHGFPVGAGNDDLRSGSRSSRGGLLVCCG